MKRSMMQAYVTGSNHAVALYQKAFDAPLISSYPHPDGTFYHAELDIQGEILAIAERDPDSPVKEISTTGNVMQFCLQFEEKDADALIKAYDVLKSNAQIITPLEPCDYSPLMTDLIDAFGVRWCMFI